MKRERIKAWITQYALTEGIEVVDAEVCHDISSSMIVHGARHTHGKDWHRTEEAAIARAEEMRKAKIASMKKSIAKLEALSFRNGE